MKCSKVRASLLETRVESLDGELADHLESCRECARFADRARVARAALREHYLVVDPDPSFAVRVKARLPEPASPFGGVALRLLPATLALALALLGWCIAATPSPGELVARATDDGEQQDLVTWIVDGGESQR